MNAEISRMQAALLNAFHAQQDRLELLSERQLDELKSEAEGIFQHSTGTQQSRADDREPLHRHRATTEGAAMKPTIITTCVQQRPEAGGWTLKMQMDFENVEHERTKRSYASAGDAFTSARHLVNEKLKPQATDQHG